MCIDKKKFRRVACLLLVIILFFGLFPKTSLADIQETPSNVGQAQLANADLNPMFGLPRVYVIFYLVFPEPGISTVPWDIQGAFQGERISEPPQPTREGYAFLGWYTIEFMPFDFNSPVWSGKELFALWIPHVTHTVTFNPAGGTRTGGGDLIQQVPLGESATAPEVSRDGWTFDGWDVEFDFITEPLTVTARWARVYRTVNFNLAGGTGDFLPVQVAHGETTTRPATDPTREGWTFTGWDFDFTTPITSDTTITAQWVRVYRTVTFDLAGGTGDFLPVQVAHGEVATRPATDPTREGWTFTGWNFDFTTPITSDTTVTAQWARVYRTVDFDLAGGTGVFLPVQVAHGEVATRPATDPTREGWTFTGWDFDFTMPITSDITITAQWEHVIPPFPFIDVPPDHWAREYVEFVFWHNPMLMGAMGNEGYLFRPEYGFSRAQVATVLWRIVGSPEYVFDAERFPDVEDNGDWYVTAAMWASEHGIVTGIPEDGVIYFAGRRNVTREQFAVMVHRFAEHMDWNAAYDLSVLSDFPDEGKVSDWATEGMAWAVEFDLIRGMPVGEVNHLQPQDTLIRSSAAAIFARLMQNGDIVG